MATIYVSQTAANGYVVGNDSNNGTAKATPKLTVEGAIAAASSGDTIQINDGVYVHATFFDTGAKSLTFLPEVADRVELRATSGTQVLLMQTQAGGSVVVGAIRINAKGVIARCVTISGLTSLCTTQFSGTTFVDPTDCAVVDTKQQHNLTMTNPILEAVNLAAVDYRALQDRLYRATDHRNGAISITAKSHASTAVARTVTKSDDVKNSVTTVRLDYK